MYSHSPNSFNFDFQSIRSKSVLLQAIRASGRAFGSRRRSEIGGIQVAEPSALFGRFFEINKRCHKNIIALLDSGAARSFLLVAQADISGRGSRTKAVEPSVWSRIVNTRLDRYLRKHLPRFPNTIKSNVILKIPADAGKVFHRSNSESL
jgi:hypothetical protein